MKTDYLELFHEAIDSLKKTTRNEHIAICGDMNQVICINGIKFYCEIKKTISNANVLSVIDGIKKQSANCNLPVILIAGKIYPKLANMFADNHINWIDKAGNCDIKHANLTIKIAGQKDTPSANIGGNFKMSETNIKLILFFLQNPECVNWPYREIQDKVGLSLGTITKVFDLLKSKHFLVKTDKGRRIAMREELVEWWQQQYNEFLKPKLLMNRMSFRTLEDRKKWKEMKLPEGMFWGGDCGANLMDGYLIPGEFEIYSDVVSNLLLRTGAVMPAPNGEIRIYKKFWIGNNNKPNLAPTLVVYADLMGTGDSRCHEAALRIKEHGI